MKQNNEIRIIIDTNLWISFLIGRKLSCLLDLLSYLEYQLVVSSELTDEIREVFMRPKFTKYYTADNLNQLLKEIPLRCRVPKEDYLLELVLLSNANFLITGDKDLLEIKQIGNCQIVTAMEFDIYASSIGHNTMLHEGLDEFYNIVIGNSSTIK